MSAHPLRPETIERISKAQVGSKSSDGEKLESEILAKCYAIRSAESFMPWNSEHETGEDCFINRKRNELKELLAKLAAITTQEYPIGLFEARREQFINQI